MKLLFLTIASLFGYFMFTPLSSSPSYNNWKRHQNNFTQELSTQKAYDENFMYMAYSNTDYKDWKLTVNKFSGFHPDTFDLYYKGYNPQTDLVRTNFKELVHAPKSLDCVILLL